MTLVYFIGGIWSGSKPCLTVLVVHVLGQVSTGMATGIIDWKSGSCVRSL